MARGVGGASASRNDPPKPDPRPDQGGPHKTNQTPQKNDIADPPGANNKPGFKKDLIQQSQKGFAEGIAGGIAAGVTGVVGNLIKSVLPQPKPPTQEIQ